MNPISPVDLKPYLDQVAAAFPGEELQIDLSLRQNAEREIIESGFQWSLRIGSSETWGFGSNFDEALAELKEKHNPEKANRKKAAEELRRQADAIERGERPIEPQS